MYHNTKEELFGFHVFLIAFSSVNVKDKFMNEYNLNCIEGWEIEEEKKQKVSTMYFAAQMVWLVICLLDVSS